MTSVTDDAPIGTAKSGAAKSAQADAVGATGDESLIARSVTINRPSRELYDFWRDFGNLPRFMDNVERIDTLAPDRTHWVVKAPGDRSVEWDSIITEDRAGEYIAWTSADDADVRNSGSIAFRDAGARGTVVTAIIAYDPPAGIIGKVVAKLFQREPAIQARRDLRRFKQLMETGEVATAARNRRELAEENN